MTESAPRDRRLLKGVVIGAIGLAVLVGGGTFALWSDAINLPGGTINAGELDLEPGTATWHAGSCTGPTIADISTYRISPGDTVCLVQLVDVTVDGSDITAHFGVDTDDITGGAELLDAITITASLSEPGFAPVAGLDNTWLVTPSATAYEDVEVSVEFEFDVDTPDQVAQLQSITLGSIAFSLDQIADD